MKMMKSHAIASIVILSAIFISACGGSSPKDETTTLSYEDTKESIEAEQESIKASLEVEQESIKASLEAVEESVKESLSSIEESVKESLSSVEESVKESIGIETEASSEVETITEAESDASNEGIRPEFKEAMDSYEQFFQEYADFMKKYSESDNQDAMLADYMDMLSKQVEVQNNLQEIDQSELNNEELKYYIEVNNRISQLLIDVSAQ